MPAAVGDVLGITCVFMPSGFGGAAPPTPPPPRDQHGDIGVSVRPSRKRAPTYHAIEVSSRIAFVGVADVHAFVPIVAKGVIDVVGSAALLATRIASDLRPSAQASLSLEASIAVAAASIEGEIRTEGDLWAQQYNERDVRLILGLPL